MTRDQRNLALTVAGGVAATVIGAFVKEWLDARGVFRQVRRAAGSSAPDDGLRG